MVKKKQIEKEVVDKVEQFLNSQTPDTIIAKRIKLWEAEGIKKLHSTYSLRPDIDLLSKKDDGNLAGFEIKVFHSGENKYLFSGIDQTLAYLRFGLTYAGLIQVFLVKIENDHITKEELEKHNARFSLYSNTVSTFLRTFNMPIGYMAFFDFLQDGKLADHPPQVVVIKIPEKSIRINEPFVNHEWEGTDEEKENRAKIREYLDKQYRK